jgi:hypothetical protein
MEDPTMSKEEAIKSTAEMSEKYLDAVQEFQESQGMQTTTSVGANDGVQPVESNGVQADTNTLDMTDASDVTAGSVDSDVSGDEIGNDGSDDGIDNDDDGIDDDGIDDDGMDI